MHLIQYYRHTVCLMLHIMSEWSWDCIMLTSPDPHPCQMQTLPHYLQSSYLWLSMHPYFQLPWPSSNLRGRVCNWSQRRLNKPGSFTEHQRAKVKLLLSHTNLLCGWLITLLNKVSRTTGVTKRFFFFFYSNTKSMVFQKNKPQVRA